MKAYRTTWKGISSIVAANARSHAVSVTFLAALDAGWRPHWTEIKARRAPEHDAWAAKQTVSRCMNEEHLP